ncbi:MAG: hypothetical protein WA057_03480, partial [Candidatus Magasanikiibacteriota bacterium]
DMDIPPFLVAFTANIIVAQRLVRKICEHCKKEYYLDKTEISELEKSTDIKKIKGLFNKQKIKLAEKEKDVGTLLFYRGEGCRRCNNTGYKGRVGIYEVLDIDKDMAKKINERATADVIKEFAREKGMTTIMEDGIVKAKQGITTIEEILRVSKD